MVFIVNQDVKNEFEDLKKLSSMLKSKSEFDVPYPFEKVEEWEKSNRVKIPDMYKSWLLLTSYARIMDGRIELFFPEIGNSDKEDVYINGLYNCAMTAKLFIRLYDDFYKSLSFNCFLFLPAGTRGIVNYNSYLYESLAGTISSIYEIVKKGIAQIKSRKKNFPK